MKYILTLFVVLASACVPMSKDTGYTYDSGNTDSALPGCMILTYCFEANWLTASSCPADFEYLTGGCPTENIIGECAVNPGGDYQGAATGYYYQGQTDPEGACWDYGNGGTYTAY